MKTENVDPLDAVRRAMGRVSPPKSIMQETHDLDDSHLRRLAQLKPSDSAKPLDLCDYAQDLRYTEIQRPLLAYLLPFCLQAWRHDLHGAGTGRVSPYVGFVERFYPVLADRHIFDAHLTAEQTAAVPEFMRHSILA